MPVLNFKSFFSVAWNFFLIALFWVVRGVVRLFWGVTLDTFLYHFFLMELKKWEVLNKYSVGALDEWAPLLHALSILISFLVFFNSWCLACLGHNVHELLLILEQAYLNRLGVLGRERVLLKRRLRTLDHRLYGLQRDTRESSWRDHCRRVDSGEDKPFDSDMRDVKNRFFGNGRDEVAQTRLAETGPTDVDRLLVEKAKLIERLRVVEKLLAQEQATRAEKKR
jgi:hypothetical protein